ncbi:succinyl-diaminopimelate desuccinylase [Aristophania vespae]|uniref:Succinyl-diaminopimelate desuccinylase n=1 Tax=Aristophania vespae TaxID=2697033 RepID=A0A6P1NFP8_9PROT|nr:succinyl-diaminopimelate desuccinylase [Aristophania vespae]QHI95350.1 succinyl-diaminopimelate desuccinylase [Aristophania vespae]UMM64619.1 Succinyl-diaminopimelate desuccinylase [Aristophania vespae]
MPISSSTDPILLLQSLLKCRSVTPADDGALGIVASILEEMGFIVTLLHFGPAESPTPNLYARLGAGKPHLCFAGHTDVVPPGGNWSHDPFSGEIDGSYIYGRGAADMKGGIACFLAAIARYLKENPLKGSLSLLITGDEEGPAHFGTKKVLQWMETQGEIPDFCLLGEPTNPQEMGEVIKIGRRGSLNATITIKGMQGHVAYPHLADNPVHKLIPLLQALTQDPLDQGSEWFAPSSLQITSIDVGNKATNVIPAQAEIKLNIRFNDLHSGSSLSAWLKELVERHAAGSEIDISVSGEAFLTKPGMFVEHISKAVEDVTGRKPRLDTGGGTSDARFITHYCPVAEFGLVGATMHKSDECVSLSSLESLTRIYQNILQRLGL